MAGEEVKGAGIEKFDGTDYGYWKMQIEDYLYGRKLQAPLEGTKPDGMSDADWKLLDRQVLGVIRLTLSRSVAHIVGKEKTTKDLMDALSGMYEKPSANNKVHLMKKLFNLKMAEGASVAHHLNEFNTITNQLSSVELDFDDEVRALILLASLPNSWDGMRTAVSSSAGKTKLKYNDIRDLILAEEIRRRDMGGISDSQNSALYTDTRSRGKSSEGGGGVQCYACKEYGHIKRNCPNRKRRDDRGKAHTVEYITDALLTTSVGMDVSTQEWILDSGCTEHVCSKKELFDSFADVQGGALSLGDGTLCEIEGVGTVKVKMFNGAVRTLGGVKYVPKMRRNLISLGRLDSKGYRCSVRGGVMQITRGGMVYAKGVKHRGLYRLVGNSMNGWKRSSRDKTSRRDVSFGVEPKRRVTVFQGRDDGEGQLLDNGGGGGSRPPSGVNR